MIANKTKINLEMSVGVSWEDEFKAHLVQRGCGPKTVAAYSQDVRRFAAWFEKENGQAFAPELVTAVDLRGYRAWAVEGRNLKPSSWNRRRQALLTFCTWLRKNGILTYDPFQGVERYEEEELPPHWLERSEAAKFLRQVELEVNGAKTEHWTRQALRDQAIIALMVFAGMREGEVVDLNLGDIELGERSGRAVIWLGKGGKKREIPLGREARNALRAWIKERGDAAGALFDGKNSMRISTRLIQRRVAEIGRKAGVEVTPHMLRHTFAKRLVDGNKPLTVVAKLLGHKRLDTTARYVKPGWHDLELAVE